MRMIDTTQAGLHHRIRPAEQEPQRAEGDHAGLGRMLEDQNHG
jgi:hypothetical protein